MTQTAPYKHKDGSNCWTVDCSRGNASTSDSEYKQMMAKIDATFQPKEKQPPTTIAGTQWDDQSYLKYGFTPINKTKPFFQEAALTEEESIQESKRDLFLASESEKKALVYFSTDNYDWVNGALYSKESLPSVKGSRANFGDGTVDTQITSVASGEQFAEDQYITPESERTQEALKEVVNTLDTALDKAPRTKTRLLYRGVQPNGQIDGKPAWLWAKQNAPVGKVLKFDGYLSTTSEYETANKTYASDKESVIFEIRTPEGLNISSISSYSDEQEVLLPRGEQYAVVGNHYVRRRKDTPKGSLKGTRIIQLVAINDKGEVLDGTNHKLRVPQAVATQQKKRWISSLFGK